MEMSLKTGFAQIFSCCPKNLSCPKFGGAAAPLAPPARTPMLLVLDITTENFPKEADIEKDGLGTTVRNLWPSFLVYITTFIVIAFLFFVHHSLFHQKNESSHVVCQQYFLGLHWLLPLLCCRIQQVYWTPQKAQRRYKAGCADWFSGHICCEFSTSSCIYCRTVERIFPPGTQSKPIHFKKQSLLSGTQAHHYTNRQPLHLLHHLYPLYSNIYCFPYCSIHNTSFVSVEFSVVSLAAVFSIVTQRSLGRSVAWQY